MNPPSRFITRMVLFLVAVGIVAALLFPALQSAFLANAALNGMILAVLLLGIMYIFQQVWTLKPEVEWIEDFRGGAAVSSGKPPSLLAPMATMLGERQGRVSLSALSMRTLLDGISSRLDESRDISRYLIGLLIFLGLLGTFWGLLKTVAAVADVISQLTVDAVDIGAVFNDLKTGLEAPLSGMATAFSSSLFGLAGSLVLGFLDLQAGQAQNRFFNDLEEWLSSLTRLSAGGGVAEGDQSVPAYIQALLEQTADGLENLQRTLAHGEESRSAADARMRGLTEGLTALTDQMRTEQDLMIRLAEGQMELKPVLAKLAEAATAGSLGMDEATRGHIRNVDTQLGRMVDEVIHGRTQTVDEVRREIRLLARTIAALAEEAER